MTRKSKTIIAICLSFPAFCLFCWLPAVQRQSDINKAHVGFLSQMNCLAGGFHAYYEQHGRLPPANVVDANGKPLYSWRVLLLPYFYETGLYEEFHLDEPWDSPHNSTLLKKMPAIYQSYDDRGPGMTAFQVIVAPGSAFDPPGLRWEQFSDGVEQTILFVEAAQPVPWTKPEDVAYDLNKPVQNLLAVFKKATSGLAFGGYGYSPVFNVAFADGGVHFLDSTIDEKTLRALFTRNGGEKVDMSKLRD